MNTFFKNNYPWILWGLFILVLFSIPANKIPEIPRFLSLFEPDKLLHIVLFAVFSFFMIRSFRKQQAFGNVMEKIIFFSVINGILLGGITEIIQHFLIRGRIASVYDFLANSAGCFLGWWIFLRWRKRKGVS